MKLLDILLDPDWDEPFFKVLARNDTGEAPGHQGGMVIPKKLRKYFPRLTGTTDAQHPTIEEHINAYLYEHNNLRGKADVRYQIQTWGGTRTPESRITDNLGPIRRMARGDDLIVIQRLKDSLNRYRFILIHCNTREYNYLRNNFVHGRRWGVLFEEPMTDQDLDEAENELSTREASPLLLFDEEPDYTVTKSRRVARSYAFTNQVKEIYNYTCCFCNTSLKTTNDLLELDAAHIVPRSKNGVDDARNGIALCKRHHWAFDKGLILISENREIIIPEPILSIPENEVLTELNGREITEANEMHLRAANQAFTWHREFWTNE